MTDSTASTSRRRPTTSACASSANGSPVSWNRTLQFQILLNESASKRTELTATRVTAQCAAIDSMVATDFAKHPIGSVTIGVVFGNQLIWTKSYGNADMEKKLPADKDTVYRIGSITKMFTALMLEQMADSGRVHLSDTVEKYFPEIKAVQGRFLDAPPITLIQLATHTSGLDREPGDAQKYVQGPVSDWEKTLIAALPHTRYAFEPGTRFFYSNIGELMLQVCLGTGQAGYPFSRSRSVMKLTDHVKNRQHSATT